MQTLRSQTLPAIFADVQRLDASLTQLAADGRTDTAGTLQQAARLSRERYDALRTAVLDAEQAIASVVRRKMNFEHNRDATLTWLAGLDKVLKTVEDLPPADPLRCATLKASIRSHCCVFSLPYLTLPAGRTTASGRHPALRPQHGPTAHPRQTSRSIEPL